MLPGGSALPGLKCLRRGDLWRLPRAHISLGIAGHAERGLTQGHVPTGGTAAGSLGLALDARGFTIRVRSFTSGAVPLPERPPRLRSVWGYSQVRRLIAL